MRGVARPVLAAGLSGACWAELGRCGEDRPCEREGRRRRAGPLRKGCWVGLGPVGVLVFILFCFSNHSNLFEFKRI